MGDKLRRAGKYIPDLDDVWRAHKLRNRIAHEPGLTLSYRDVESALAALEKAVLRFCK